MEYSAAESLISIFSEGISIVGTKELPGGQPKGTDN